MSQQRVVQPFRKKYAYNNYQDQPTIKPSLFQTPSKYNTIDSNHLDADISNAKFSIQSSRIADQNSQVPIYTTIPNKQRFPPHFEQLLRDKLEYFQAETAKLIEKKERDNYFLQVELQNYQVRLNESELLIQGQQEQIQKLRGQVQELLTEAGKLSQTNQDLQESLLKMGAQNSRLKQSLDLLVSEQNATLKQANQREYMTAQTNFNSHHLKREVEDLRVMIAEMEHAVKNCPSCFTLRRENEELAEAYNHLKDMYSHLSREKNKHEKDLLQNITAKIQENQNIVRENMQLKERRNGSGLRAGRQKLKQSVAKRCRTLTDQF